jgi:hypothetical protein
VAKFIKQTFICAPELIGDCLQSLQNVLGHSVSRDTKHRRSGQAG